MFARPLNYFRTLPRGKVVLWCYLIWWMISVFNHFDPAPLLWLNALGIAVIVGFALLLGVGRPGGKAPDRWQVMRLFLTPFCVSSFSSLIKGRGFVLVVPPDMVEALTSVSACAAFVALVAWARR